MDSIHEHLGKAIATQRDRLKMTQGQVADLAGVHRNTISKLEAGNGKECTLALCDRICSAVGLELAVCIRGAARLRSESLNR